MAYGTRRFNVAFTRALVEFLSWAESTQFLVLIPISSRLILILSSHLILGLPKGLLPAGVPVNILKALLPFFLSGYMTCPSHSSILNHPVYVRWAVQTMKFLILLPSPLPILIPLWSKYSPHDPVFKYPLSALLP